MPIFEYRCLGCEKIFDYIVIRTDDEGPEECECCGHKDVEKIMSSGSFTIEMSAREQLFEKTLPSIKKDTEDMFNGNESKMEKVLGEEKANEIVTNRIRGEKALDQIKRTK
jgi:putative FmdB family regulatory protein